MNRAYLVYGALAVGLGIAVVAVLFVYPFSLSAPHPSGDAAETFTTPDATAYTATGAIHADEELFISFTAHVTAGSGQYYLTEAPNVTVERVAPPDRDGVIYARYRYAIDDRANETIARIEDDEDETIVEMETRADENEYVFFTAENASAGALRQSTESVSSLVVTNLYRLQYREIETTAGGERVTFEPRDGWYDGATPYRITDSDGHVEVSSASYEIQDVDVEYTYTRNTPTYIHYLVNRDDTATLAFTYTFTDEQPDVPEPDWVSDIEG